MHIQQLPGLLFTFDNHILLIFLCAVIAQLLIIYVTSSYLWGDIAIALSVLKIQIFSPVIDIATGRVWQLTMLHILFSNFRNVNNIPCMGTHVQLFSKIYSWAIIYSYSVKCAFKRLHGKHSSRACLFRNMPFMLE